MFNADQTEEFSRLGFIIERQLVDVDTCRKMLDVVHNSLHPPLGPLEFETDVQYLGSPTGRPVSRWRYSPQAVACLYPGCRVSNLGHLTEGCRPGKTVAGVGSHCSFPESS